jgi:acetoin:2,6-dichlorophenolindophenol oxidoreductase subunit alpha
MVDGNDVLAVYGATKRAVDRARSGGGPSLVECKAGRFFGHMEGFDQQGYRGEGEVEVLRSEKDPLTLFTTRVAGQVSDAELAEVDVTVDALVEVAVAEAKAAPEPDVSELLTDVYVSY